MERDPSVNALAQILGALFPGEVWDDSPLDTARRVIRAWSEFRPADDINFNFTTFESKVNQLIVVKNIEFSSLCCHHLFPFDGVAHVGYIPNKVAVGLSKIPRLVEYISHRPCTQEVLTAKIADEMKHRLDAMGVAVVVESRHTCMACRGIRAFEATMTTSEMRGVFLTAASARSEFLSLIGASK